MFWFLAVLALAVIFYVCIVRPFTYWSRKGIRQKSIIEEWTDALSLILQLKPNAELNQSSYNAFEGQRYHGSYQFLLPLLSLRDPDLIKQITVKDFDHFADHRVFIPEDIEPLFGKNLIALTGERWRDMRATLSPSFTSSRMKAMFYLMNDCAQQFLNHFNKTNATQLVDMKDAFSRFANDVIASTAFGITCNSLEDRDNEFYMMGKEATNMRGFWRGLRTLSILVAPRLCSALGIKMFHPKIYDFFVRLIKTNIESREKNNVVRPDMIHLLMEAQKGRLKHEDQSNVLDTGFAVIEESSIGKQSRQKPKLTDDDLAAQIMIFFFAGFESVSGIMCFLVYELAVNIEIQEALRKEVTDTLNTCNGVLTYDALLKMKYMDMVVSETLRKWPVAIGMDRVCVKPYTIQPVKEGEVPIHIEKGEVLGLPIYGLHRSPEYYPNPDRFDPERFSDENKANIHPYAYIPFGAGPRSCIGNRFALLEIKTITFHILQHFEIQVSETTTIPLKLAKNNFSLYADTGFWFKLKPLDS